MRMYVHNPYPSQLRTVSKVSVNVINNQMMGRLIPLIFW